MSRDVTPAELTPTAGLPTLPPGGIALPPGVPRPSQLPRVFPPDAVEFDAQCPGCGITAQWTEKREDTHVVVTIDCRICDRRDRMRLAASA